MAKVGPIGRSRQSWAHSCCRRRTDRKSSRRRCIPPREARGMPCTSQVSIWQVRGVHEHLATRRSHWVGGRSCSRCPRTDPDVLTCRAISSWSRSQTPQGSFHHFECRGKTARISMHMSLRAHPSDLYGSCYNAVSLNRVV